MRKRPKLKNKLSRKFLFTTLPQSAYACGHTQNSRESATRFARSVDFFVQRAAEKTQPRKSDDKARKRNKMIRRIFKRLQTSLQPYVMMYYIDPETGEKNYSFRQSLGDPKNPGYTYWSDDDALASVYRSPEEARQSLEEFPAPIPPKSALQFKRIWF